MFSHLRITGKMLFVLGIFVTFLLGIGLLANSTIEEVKVTGPIYKDIVLGKDLVADILPPPEYIIESYLTAFEVAGITNQAKIHERLSRLAELRKDYDTRHAYWETNLKDPAIREALLDDAHASAMAFYSCLQGKFVPAIQKSDHTEAMNLLYGELRDHYEKHRSAIDHVVSLANASVDATEAKAKITLQERIWWLLAGLGGMLLLTVSLLIVLSRSFTVPLNKAVAFAKSIRAGDFSSDVEVRGKDEIAELGRALKAIPEILEDVCSTVEDQVRAVERGELANRADVSPFPGEFGKLVAGGNALADMYMGIINLVPTPFTIISPDFGVRFINRVGLQVGGLSFAEATTKKCRDIFHAEDCGKNCACQRVLHSGQSETAQTHCRPNGQEMEINYTGAPLTDREGKVIGVMEIVTDLTALKATQRRIENTARKATDIAERLANAAEELSAQVEHVTEGSRVQRQLMEETSTAMEQMNASVIDVARNSSEAAKGVDGSKGQAVSGAAVVGKVVSAMSQVDTQARDLKTHMQGLGNQAEAIGQVMNVISDIADQTNLLALNAAIEAARAGEAGRGFAVVADEVRKLAEKTMAATREVGETIRAIQDAARTSIDSAEAASQTISQATRLAGESGEVLQQIVATAEQNAGQVQGIAAAAEEQSATSEQINSAVAEVSKIVHETAEGMAQSNEAVREVSRMSADLSELMRQMS